MIQYITTFAENTGEDIMSLIGQSFDLTAQLESLSLPRILLALLTATLYGAIIYLVSPEKSKTKPSKAKNI